MEENKNKKCKVYDGEMYSTVKCVLDGYDYNLLYWDLYVCLGCGIVYDKQFYDGGNKR